MEKPFVDADEMTYFIFEKCKYLGYLASKELINLILDLEVDFLESKGLVTYTED
ncbi:MULTISPECIES: hypothetical protein [Clostridium]|uniref:hypothetical protein n=1 Tax=Clostridium TaxID=1485 RepID=UPI00189F0C72|nr:MULTISPECIES: hypothetical protein [Clostridium]MDB1949260.1 hypothetical protein [Clostridium tertium]